jgi:alkylation response protein AidB-like acyl-CoA dehydrogenase
VNTHELTEFRNKALEFLHANASPKQVEASGWGIGDDGIGLLEGHVDRDAEREGVERARKWRQHVFDSGFGWLGGPTDLGGAGRSPHLDRIYRDLERGFDVPDQQPFATGMNLVAPAVLAHGSDDVKRRYVPGMFRGDLLACQLLSEPEAGSDLAGLKTRAVRDGDHWVVTGQKVWTSQAHLAEVGQLLARTDPDLPKHKGISMFLMDMDTPGVTVRALRQMTGETHFNEVFLDEVHIPAENLVGEPGAGWGAVMATLQAERAAVGAGDTNAAVDPVARLIDLAQARGRSSDPTIRQELARAHTAAEIRRHLAGRHQADSTNPAAGSILKLLFAVDASRCADIAGHILGSALTADGGSWGTYSWGRWVTGAPMMHIAGGTDEIQRNVLGERVLGLPKEPT